MPSILILLATLIALPNEAVLVSSNGERVRGTLVAINDDGIVFQDSSTNQARQREIGKIASIEFGSPSVRAPNGETIRVDLVDESTFTATSFLIKDGVASFQLPNDLELQVEKRNLASIRFNHVGSPELVEQWLKLQASDPESGDALVINREGSLDSLEGIVGEITAERIQFKMNDQEANVRRGRIFGVVFFHASGRELADSRCQITLTDESLLNVREIKYQGDRLDCILVSGTKLDLPLTTVSRMDFSGGRSLLLGNVTPTSRDWTPLIANAKLLDKLRALKLPRANRSFDNRKLDLRFYSEDGYSRGEIRSYESGYAMVSGSKLAFALEKKYERLTGVVGFSPRAGDGGDLRFVIRGDSGILFERRIQNHETSNPIEFDLSIRDVERVVFEADYEDGRATGDMIHLCDVKVSR